MGEREDFLRELRALARKKGLLLVIDMKKGKGSHYEIRVGGKRTIVPSHLKHTMRKALIKQLGLDKA
jgi:hypothetical protein